MHNMCTVVGKDDIDKQGNTRVFLSVSFEDAGSVL